MKKHVITQNDLKIYFNKQEIGPFLKKIKTPSFLYFEEEIQMRILHFYKEFNKSFKKSSPTICYAMKANSNPTILKIIKELDCGADIVSFGEMQKAIKAKIPVQKIIFSGVGKTRLEIKNALKLSKGKILSFNVESLSELGHILEEAKKSGLKARISLRLNPQVKTKTHKYISTGDLNHKFGLHFKEALKCLNIIKENCNLKLVGLSIHIGSQLSETLSTKLAVSELTKLIDEVNKRNMDLDFLDFGGGVGIDYEESEKPIALKEYFKCIKTALGPYAKNIASGKWKAVFEPGRFLVARSGILVAKVIRTKNNARKYFVIVDAGMNDLIRPALYESYHRIFLYPTRFGKKVLADIVGPICESSDFLANNRKITLPKEEDLVIIADAGAYGRSMGSTYNSRKETIEYLMTKKGTLKNI